MVFNRLRLRLQLRLVDDLRIDVFVHLAHVVDLAVQVTHPISKNCWRTSSTGATAGPGL